jgi:hypothetical protein
MTKPRLEAIRIVWEYDNYPDLSYLEPGANPDYEEENADSLARYHRGECWHEGCHAVATTSTDAGNGDRRLEELQSGGLWGIENEAPSDHHREIEEQELADLRQHLESYNVDTSNFDELVATAEGRKG